MSSQRPLFDDDKLPPRPAPERSLTFRPGPGRPLTSRQKAFNRLLTKVERLRTQLRALQEQLDQAMVFHAAEVRPRITRAIAVRTDLIRELRPFLTDRRLKAPDRRILKSIVVEQLDDVLTFEPTPADDLKDLFAELHGHGLDDAVEEDMDDARAEMEAMFGDLGLKVDLSGFKAGMSEEELAAQAAELADQMRQQSEAMPRARVSRRPSKREVQAAERQQRVEEARKTSLTSIYRRLAKVVHPDLEPDPVARERKGALMQELTEAHARQDLHTLLRMELEWIHHEGTDATRLADDTLSVYIDALQQQAGQLEVEHYMLHDHPKYADVVQETEFGITIIVDGRRQAAALDHSIAILSDGLRQLQSADALEHVRQSIQMRRSRESRRSKPRRATSPPRR